MCKGFSGQVITMMGVEFDRVMSLQEMAVFEIARQLWCLDEITEVVNQYCPVFNELTESLPSIEDIVKTVQASLFQAYPIMPAVLANHIFHAIKSIGKIFQFAPVADPSYDLQ